MNFLVSLISLVGAIAALFLSGWLNEGVVFSISGALMLVGLLAAFDYVPPGFRWLVRAVGKGLCQIGLHEPQGPPSFMTRGLAEKIQTKGFDDHCSRCGEAIHWFPLGDADNGYASRL